MGGKVVGPVAGARERGSFVGDFVVGAIVGTAEGAAEGLSVGSNVGGLVRSVVGTVVSFAFADGVRRRVGVAVGVVELSGNGYTVGWRVQYDVSAFHFGDH